ncbi:MAG: Trm112 family protein [Candidatus Eisenbacteria sp.]|nr:Trm112 family protein [Candidatus Eisenbacteria bacterium]
MIDRNLLDILACPGCKGPLTYEADRNALVCDACRLRFRIEDDIPIMLLDEAEKIEG